LLPLWQSATIRHLPLPLIKMKIHAPAMVRNPPFPPQQTTMTGNQMWLFLKKTGKTYGT
jgi:hypothetical protein